MAAGGKNATNGRMYRRRMPATNSISRYSEPSRTVVPRSSPASTSRMISPAHIPDGIRTFRNGALSSARVRDARNFAMKSVMTTLPSSDG